MLTQFKSKWEGQLEGLGKSLSWIHPNVLTVIGIIPYIVFYILMQQHEFGWAAVALAFSIIDVLDGVVARVNHKTTRFGALLDSTVDRVCDAIAIWAFYAAGLVSIDLALMLIITSYIISYIRSRAELASDGKIKFNRGLIERPERILYLLIVVILHANFPDAHLGQLTLPYAAFKLLLILSFITVFQRLWQAYQEL